MKNSAIEWTDSTFNPWIGCQRVSPGCVNCYAETRDNRFAGGRHWGPKGTRQVTSDANWRTPLRWNRDAEVAGVPAKVFCASLADVFEDRPDLEAPRARLFALIQSTPWLRWQLLTKRPENVLRMVPENWDPFPRNVWMGTSVEDQQRFDERIRHLVRIPAFTCFLSYEPALEGVDMLGLDEEGSPWLDYIDWVIIGGESGPGARPFNVEWARDVTRQCRSAGTAAFVKQLGAKPYSIPDRIAHRGHSERLPDGFYRHLNDPKGGDSSEWPEDLRVREFPPHG